MTRLLLRVSLLAAALIVTNAASSRAAWPLVVSETVYTPTSSILATPTAYVIPTSLGYSGLQTVRYTPTSYYLNESAYVLPRRYYRPTAYYLPRSYYLPRTYVTRSVLDYAVTPTAYYLPTTVSMPLVTTSASSLCCDVQPACESVTSAAPIAQSAPETNNGSLNFNPDANGEDNTPSLNDTNKVIQSSPKAAAPVAPKDSSVGTPPETTTPAPAAPAEVNPTVPTAPVPEDPLGTPPTADLEHEVRRPVYRASTARSTLLGKIVSATDGKPEKGVTVTLTDARGRFKDKTRVTGDDGTFSVVLPEGDWSVQVPSTDGKSVLERPITVSGGLITDDKDTAVSMLTFNR